MVVACAFSPLYFVSVWALEKCCNTFLAVKKKEDEWDDYVWGLDETRMKSVGKAVVVVAAFSFWPKNRFFKFIHLVLIILLACLGLPLIIPGAIYVLLNLPFYIIDRKNILTEMSFVARTLSLFVPETASFLKSLIDEVYSWYDRESHSKENSPSASKPNEELIRKIFPSSEENAARQVQGRAESPCHSKPDPTFPHPANVFGSTSRYLAATEAEEKETAYNSAKAILGAEKMRPGWPAIRHSFN